jgi:micrococcal nuclease
LNQPFSARYRARCTRVVDGDTIDVTVDLGFRLTATMRLRLWGIDTAEMNDKDEVLRKQAQDAKDLVTKVTLSPAGSTEWPIRIETLKDPDNFGRWLAKVWYLDSDKGFEVLLNDELIILGLAEAYRR